jgi:myo-inositol-1(or 4)-monophosphatase
MLNYENICHEIVNAVRDAAVFITKEYGRFDIRKTEIKGLNDFVSYVDKGSESMLVENLGKILPEAGFIVEEGTSSKKGMKYCWVVDPLDGTTNFLHGIHPFAISVALMKYDEIVAGVVYEVYGKEIFSAWKNGGAWLNNQQIHVSAAEHLADSLVATGFPYSDFTRLDDFMESLKHFCKTTHGIRRLGSASLDLAYVACGKFEAFYEYGLNPWDVAAGTLLVREAGGLVSDFSGNEKNISGDEIAAASDLVFPEFLENIRKFMHRQITKE